MMKRKATGARPVARKAGAKKAPTAKKAPLAKGVPTTKRAAVAKKVVTAKRVPIAKKAATTRKAPVAKKTIKKGATRPLRKAAPAAVRQAPAKKAVGHGPSRARIAPRKAPAVSRPSAPRRVTPAGPSLAPKVLRASFIEIVRRTSADLPPDVVRAIEAGRAGEEPGSNASWAMNVIVENIDLAREASAPLCQDTGTIIFYVRAPRGFDETAITRAAAEAVSEATARGYLRQNSVDSLTGRNSGNNLGPGSPVFHIHQWGAPEMEVRLVLKGGGCENVGIQYSLPDTKLGAGRDLVGVEKCILDAAYQAQGKGCGPGILGVCIGGDRATGYAHSKEQFLRSLDDRNSTPELASLEERVTAEANRLGIGPMGFGGATTLLGCKIGVLNRLPASFFVSISYMCWAYRRQGAALSPDGSIRAWLY
jgi:fumarate hydratase, class I